MFTKCADTDDHVIPIQTCKWSHSEFTQYTSHTITVDEWNV